LKNTCVNFRNELLSQLAATHGETRSRPIAAGGEQRLSSSLPFFLHTPPTLGTLPGMMACPKDDRTLRRRDRDDRVPTGSGLMACIMVSGTFTTRS
jgi:hypothetical protein